MRFSTSGKDCDPLKMFLIWTRNWPFVREGASCASPEGGQRFSDALGEARKSRKSVFHHQGSNGIQIFTEYI